MNTNQPGAGHPIGPAALVLGPTPMVEQSREVRLESRKFKVVRKTFSKPDGGTLVRDVVEHPGAVVVLPFLDDQTVLLIRNDRPQVGRVLLEIPAGTLEVGEQPAACAVRELEEETGYTTTQLEPLIEYFPSPGVLSERMYCYTARRLQHVGSRLEPDEAIELHPTPLRDIPSLCHSGQIQDGKTLVCLLLVLSQLSTSSQR